MIVAEGLRGRACYADTPYLQWGRNMIVAEGKEPARAIVARVGPSMGPQHDSCGRVRATEPVSTNSILQWGRNMIVAEGVRALVIQRHELILQWGRNMIVAEGALALPLPVIIRCLQWGRNMIVAEGSRPYPPSRARRPFNGAAT